MYRDIFDTIGEDVSNMCGLLCNVRDSIKSRTKVPSIDMRSEYEKDLELERDQREYALRLAGSIN